MFLSWKDAGREDLSVKATKLKGCTQNVRKLLSVFQQARTKDTLKNY